MWRFTTAWDSDGHPLLHSLNGNVGRQVRQGWLAGVLALPALGCV